MSGGTPLRGTHVPEINDVIPPVWDSMDKNMIATLGNYKIAASQLDAFHIVSLTYRYTIPLPDLSVILLGLSPV